MLKNIIISLFILTALPVFSQKDSTVELINRIEAANGKLSIEKYFPVDSMAFKYNWIYLNERHCLTRQYGLNGVYRFLNHDNKLLDISKHVKGEADSVWIDSTSWIKSNMRDPFAGYTIKNAFIRIRKGTRYHCITIKNGYVHKVNIRKIKTNEALVRIDLSGLYSEEKYWPVTTVYKKGTVKSRVTYVKLKQGDRLVLWKP